MAFKSLRTKLFQEILSSNGKSGLGELQMARAIYDFSLDGGAIAEIIPVNNCLIPDNAVIVGGTINVTTAVTSATGANLTIGTTAGSAADSLLASTAKGSLTLNALINAVPVFATPVKMTAVGYISVTPDAVLTAGVIEITLFFFVAKA